MKTYRIDVISLMPELLGPIEDLGVIGRAFSSNIAEIHFHNPRDFATDKYHKVDDSPYGGGAGMLLKPEPIFEAFESIPNKKRRRVLMMSPQGNLLQQKDLKRWSNDYDQLILICGQYEGFDERIRTLADEEVSIGDYVITGGELPAMTIINGLVRLLPGTLGSMDSLEEESHNEYLLEHPQYTRPAVYRGMKVPEVLRSGDHGAISKWRLNKRKQKTKEKRADLFSIWEANYSYSNQTRIQLQSEFGYNNFSNKNDSQYPDW